jgi:hypothetical protein
MTTLRLTVSIWILAGVIIVIAPEQSVFAQNTQSQQNIMHLVKLTHVDVIVREILTETTKKLEFSFPQVSADVIQEFMDGVNTEKAVHDILIPIYEKHFTPAEIEELLRFYESPVGKKMIALRPQITQEAIEAVQSWGHTLAQKFIKQLDERKNR